MDTPLKLERERRGLSRQQVVDELGKRRCKINITTLYRLEEGGADGDFHSPKRDMARALYQFYGGAVAYVDIVDPMLRVELGQVEQRSGGGFRVVTRRGEFLPNTLDELRAVLVEHRLLKHWQALFE